MPECIDGEVLERSSEPRAGPQNRVALPGRRARCRRVAWQAHVPDQAGKFRHQRGLCLHLGRQVGETAQGLVEADVFETFEEAYPVHGSTFFVALALWLVDVIRSSSSAHFISAARFSRS